MGRKKTSPGQGVKVGKGYTMNGAYRTADGKATIEWELKDTERGPEFSASGEYAGGCGQCLEYIAAAYPRDAKVAEIVGVWREYHLNGMKAGTREQMARVRAAQAEAERLNRQADADGDDDLSPCRRTFKAFRRDWFGTACEVLRETGLYVVPADDAFENTYRTPTVKTMYRFGEAWLHWEIPAGVLARIKSWADWEQPEGSQGDYNAAQFLKRNGLRVRIAYKDSAAAPWAKDGESGDRYRVTVWRDGKPGRMAFDFWGSIADAAKGDAPSVYDVLSCVAMDINTPDSFAEFCAEYGDGEDSRAALATFKWCDKHAQRLRAFFTEDEREQLAEIA